MWQKSAQVDQAVSVLEMREAMMPRRAACLIVLSSALRLRQPEGSQISTAAVQGIAIVRA